MKNLKIITAVTLIFLLFTSCDKEPKPEIISEETPAPEIIITTEDPLAINADGGEYRLEYKIKNASEDGKISANAGESNWIFDLNCDTDGVVSFIASANENTDERSADITVVYTYNNTKTISASINVVQSAIEINYDFEMEIQDFSGFYYGSDNGITVCGISEGTEITVYDIAGKTVCSTRATGDTAEINGLRENMIYIVKVTDGTKTKAVKATTARVR